METEQVYEVSNAVEYIAINYSNVEYVEKVPHGFIIHFSSGRDLFLSDEQKENLKRLK